MKIQLALLFLFFAQTNSIKEWLFSVSDMSDVLLYAQIGSPPQNASIYVTADDDRGNCNGLVLSGVKNHQEFNISYSKTFKKTGNFKDHNRVAGVIGTDDFFITSSDNIKNVLKQKTFNVIDNERSECWEMAFLHLAYSTENNPNDFLDSVLADEKEQTLIFVYDEVVQSVKKSTGKMFIGGTPGICSSDWHRIPSISSYPVFNVSRLSVGKFATINPGQMHIDLGNPDILVPSDIYTQVAEQLNAFDDMVPCNSVLNITYNLNGFDLQITPKEYVGRPVRNNKDCEFNVYDLKGSDLFYLPMHVISTHYCLMFDFKSKEIGFSDQLNKSY